MSARRRKHRRHAKRAVRCLLVQLDGRGRVISRERVPCPARAFGMKPAFRPVTARHRELIEEHEAELALKRDPKRGRRLPGSTARGALWWEESTSEKAPKVKLFEQREPPKEVLQGLRGRRSRR